MLPRIAGEAIHIDNLVPGGVVFFVETIEEATVEEWNVGKELQCLVFGNGKQLLVAVQILDAVFVFSLLKRPVIRELPVHPPAGIHALVECAEEQVLENSAVECAVVVLHGLEHTGQVARAEE